MKRKLIISIIMSLLLVLTIGISAYAEGNDLDNSSQQQTGDTTPQVTSGGNENQTVSDNVNQTVNDNANQADANNQNNDNNQGNNLGDNNQGDSNLDDNNQGDINNQDDNSNLNQGDSNNQVDNNQGNSVEDNPNDTSTNNSGYTVDLSYQEKTASITGGTTENLLSDVLKNIGIEDEIIDAKAYQDVACTVLAEDGIVKDGDKELFKIYQKDSLWYIDSINSFETEHGLWIKTIQSQNISQYKIKVTDPSGTTYNYLNPVYNTTDTPTSGIASWAEDTAYISDGNVISSSNKLTAWGAAGTETWYAVKGTITFYNQTITVTGDVHLVLLNGCNLTVNGNSGAGICVTGSNKFTIYAQSTGNNMGRLTVKGTSYGAGIGGSNSEDGSNITINGGTVKATGASYGAGIGGGSNGVGSNIIINGGAVTAIGGSSGAGIGGGKEKDGSNIIINGGTVTATGGSSGAGIGGGLNGSSSEIKINDGTVTAIGGSFGAGIGGGQNEAGCNITINGGTVTATGGSSGAGIGGGQNGDGNNIIINGGTVTATGKDSGAGIGGGNDKAGSNITINGGTVTATGGSSGAGIGGGYKGAGSDVIINGGIVTATSVNYGAGIGGGCYGAGSYIEINGGTVKATGGSNGGAGIGGGQNGTSSEIKVTTTHEILAGTSTNPTSVICEDRSENQDIAATISTSGRYVIISRSCITFSSDAEFSIQTNKNWTDKIYYSTDKATWTEWDGKSITAGVDSSGNKYNLYMYGTDQNTVVTGDNTFNATYKWNITPTANKTVSCSGNLETLRGATGNNASPTPMGNNCYKNMFYGCTCLTSAPDLPATTLVGDCYMQMFYGCKSLTTAPDLPATILAMSCYNGMFYGCTSLTTAPTLSAKTLASGCYNGMFYGCTSLTTAPDLPATTLAQACYSYMFYGCTSLTTAPNLPATTLAMSCYNGMFYGCTSLTTAPNLPAKKLAQFCYSYMFYGCTSLTTAPNLPATTLTSGCYSGMFYGCSSLKVYEGTSTKNIILNTKTGYASDVTTQYSCVTNMFGNTGGDFKSTPKSDKIYYFVLQQLKVTSPETAAHMSYCDSARTIIVVKPIALDTLHEAIQTAINETLIAKDLKLFATIQVYELSGDSRIDKGLARFEFDSSILNGKDPSTLRAWKINDDNTMTEVVFEIVDGEIIFNNGELGTYILTD